MKQETGIIRTGNDGVQENIVIERHRAIYPYEHMVTRIIGYPTKQGKQSKHYAAIKKDLGDDWVSDYTDSWFMPGTFDENHMATIDRLLRQEKD